jgi:hypothetical protein
MLYIYIFNTIIYIVLEKQGEKQPNQLLNSHASKSVGAPLFDMGRLEPGNW